MTDQDHRVQIYPAEANNRLHYREHYFNEWRAPFTIQEDRVLDDLQASTTSPQFGVLPPIVRWISRSGLHVLLERPPQVMSVAYYGVQASNVGNAQRQVYEIPLPWTVYSIQMDDKLRPVNVYVFGAKGPISSYQDTLEVLPLVNCDHYGRFCTPTPKWDTTEKWTIAQGINAGYAQVWESNFNTDITTMIDEAYASRLPSAIFEGTEKAKGIELGSRVSGANIYKRWEKYDIQDVLQWAWQPEESRSTETVGAIIQRARDEDARHTGVHLFNTLRSKLRSAVVYE